VWVVAVVVVPVRAVVVMCPRVAGVSDLDDRGRVMLGE
jgi:hypothetical protein